MTQRAAFLVAAITLSHALTARGQDSIARRADALFSRFTVGVQPGVAVAVVRNGKVVFSKGYGYADIEHRIPITTSSAFDAASVSKQFTGLAVSMLVDRGKVKLADDIWIAMESSSLERPKGWKPRRKTARPPR